MSRPRLVGAAKSGPALAPELLVQMHDLMVKSRALEERLIQMYKQGDGFFWIGGPGEEAFNVPLGLLIKKGSGLDHDYLHFHYRQSATLVAMGEDPANPMRQMKNTATDPYSGGRNFAGHFSKREWNMAPVSSPIEVQYSMAIGTAYAQKRHGGDGITIVTGGDAGTAEGDFATCLVWSSRPGAELPVLMIVTHNRWGISTASSTQQGPKRIADRATGFGIKNKTIDGNDPVVAYAELQAAMEYVRKERKPFLLEANVARLFGHSSADGANLREEEVDCIANFEESLEASGVMTRAKMDAVHEKWAKEMAGLARKVREEPQPQPEDVWNHIFWEGN